MAWEDDQLLIQRVELLKDRLSQLLVAATYQIVAPNAAMKQGIAAKDAIRLAYQAHTTGRMAGRMHNLQRERAELDTLPLFEQDIGCALHRRIVIAEERRGWGVAVHKYIICMDRQRHWIDRADSIDCARMIEVAMGINNIFRHKIESLDLCQYTFCLIAGIDNHCLARPWARIEITVFFEHPHRHTCHNGLIDILFMLCVGHDLAFSSWPSIIGTRWIASTSKRVR